MTGTIKDNKVYYYTPTYFYMSDTGTGRSGGDKIFLTIENIDQYELANKDTVEFVITDRNTAIISKIKETHILKLTLGDIINAINDTSDEYEIESFRLDGARTNEIGDIVFNYKFIVHPKGRKYSNYIIEEEIDFLIEVEKENLWEEVYNVLKNSDKKLIGVKPAYKTTRQYDMPNKNYLSEGIFDL